MKQKLIVTAAVATMLAGMAFAQRPGRMAGQQAQRNPQRMQQRHVERLATVLGLTDAQKQQAAAIFASAAEQNRALRPQIGTAEASLREAVKTNNTAQIDSLAAEIGRLHGQLRAIQAKTQAQFYALLTTEQRDKYDALRPGRPGRGRPGPGMGAGPMGPPPAK